MHQNYCFSRSYQVEHNGPHAQTLSPLYIKHAPLSFPCAYCLPVLPLLTAIGSFLDLFFSSGVTMGTLTGLTKWLDLSLIHEGNTLRLTCSYTLSTSINICYTVCPYLCT